MTDKEYKDTCFKFAIHIGDIALVVSESTLQKIQPTLSAMQKDILKLLDRVKEAEKEE